MTNSKSCTIKLLNKTYEVRCPESEEANLLLASKKINSLMTGHKNKSKKLDSFQTLLLAALDISHELIVCKNEQEHHRNQVSQFISSIENRINHLVNGDPDYIPQTD